VSEIEVLLGESSAAAQKIPQFRSRPQQIEMARAVNDAIATDTGLIVEAGTGTGKTLAYLLPALASGKRVIVSTGTRQLQDQLLQREVPTALGLLGSNASVALLKGRANYVCPHRLDTSLRLGHEPVLQAELRRIQAWQVRSRTGDLGEVLALEERSAVVPMVSSTADNCLGQRCSHFDSCPVYRARGEANEADLIIVNHHLLFADLALKEDTIGQVLPGVDVILVDECHQLSALLPAFLGTSLSSRQLLEAPRDAMRELRLLGDSDGLVLNAAARLEEAVNELTRALVGAAGGSAPDRLQQPAVRALVRRIDGELAELAAALERHRDRSLDLTRCCERMLRLSDRFATLSEPVEIAGQVQWFEVRERGFVLRVTPASFADEFRRWLDLAGATWIFASATVAVGGDFGFFQDELGLGDVRAVRFDSPFLYEEQAAMLVPDQLPLPSSDEHCERLVDYCLPLLRENRGRTFFLVTSYAAMAEVAHRLSSAPGIGSICVQGAMPRGELLAKFRTSERAVLVATYSFWEGVDVRGTDLRLLIIDKLPFLSPADPVLQSRERAYRQAGEDGFRRYALPRAAIALRQGFGRLIRDEQDEGLFVLGDLRVFSRDYGVVFLQSLPHMPVLRSCERAVSLLKARPAGAGATGVSEGDDAEGRGASEHSSGVGDSLRTSTRGETLG